MIVLAKYYFEEFNGVNIYLEITLQMDNHQFPINMFYIQVW